MAPVCGKASGSLGYHNREFARGWEVCRWHARARKKKLHVSHSVKSGISMVGGREFRGTFSCPFITPEANSSQLGAISEHSLADPGIGSGAPLFQILGFAKRGYRRKDSRLT